MQGMSESQMQGMNQGLIGNNMPGSPVTLPAGGLAVVVVTSAITFAVLAFVISWKQRSFGTGRIAGSKRHHPYDTPSSEHELCDSGPHNWSRRWAGNIWAWCGKGYQNGKDGSGNREITTYCIESKKLESRRTESLSLSVPNFIEPILSRLTNRS